MAAGAADRSGAPRPVRILRLTLVAHLEQDPGSELERARGDARAGEESWHEWIEDHVHDRALIVRIELSVDLEAGGRVERVAAAPSAVWLELERDPPRVERQLQEIATTELGALEARLRRHAVVHVTADELAGMFVHVELAPDVLARLGGGAPPLHARG